MSKGREEGHILKEKNYMQRKIRTMIHTARKRRILIHTTTEEIT